MSELLRYPAKVLRVEERFVDQWVSGFGTATITEKASLGWFIVFDNFLSLPCGRGRPEFQSGDAVRLTVEKVP